MASRLYYLLTYLPPLPVLGEPLSDIDAIQKIRDEGEGNLTLIADLLELERIIEAIAQSHYIDKEANYKPELPEWLPEELTIQIMSFRDTQESDWLTATYSAWLAIIIEMASKTGSKLLKQWAKWEWSLRAMLMSYRYASSGSSKEEIEEAFPAFIKDGEANDFNHLELINTWQNTADPMDAEMVLDQARIDFLNNKFSPYSFEIDELIAYMIELRIHNRYARLSLEEGRKILEEVTKL